MTDNAGKYTIEIPAGSKSLTFSFIGMQTQEINIGASTQINVTMIETQLTLDEVVVVGYGTQKKIDLTGSVSVVSAQDFQKAPVTGCFASNAGKSCRGFNHIKFR